MSKYKDLENFIFETRHTLQNRRVLICRLDENLNTTTQMLFDTLYKQRGDNIDNVFVNVSPRMFSFYLDKAETVKSIINSILSYIDEIKYEDDNVK